MLEFSTTALKKNRQAKLILSQELQPSTDAVVGWGHKKTAEKARSYAREHNLPYIALEDGFLRSLDLGCNGAQALSLVLDRSGIYYDAGTASDLENLLNIEGWETPELLAAASSAMRQIVLHRLSKYNQAPDAPDDIWANIPAPHVLLIDQTAGDASIGLGCADGNTFKNMLDAALAKWPKENICIKTHPDVLAGKKQGCLGKYGKKKGIRIIAADCSPLSLLAQADVVYTVTSQMGFEALLLAKKVYCFGLPFYAGWGLTEDAQICPRRRKKRTVTEVFAAAYLLYARYIDPVRQQLCDIHETISLLAEQRRQNERNRGYHACLGFRWWKRPYARAYLHSTGGKIEFFANRKKAVQAAISNSGELVVWSSAVDPSLVKYCAENKVTLARMEDGFIRSVGLGANFNWPYSLVLDRKGIYYDPNTPSELEDILNAMPQHPEHDQLAKRAAALRELILKNRLTKYNMNIQANRLPVLPEDKTIVLVPGQVEDDASVRCGGFGLSNLDLLAAARKARPEAFIIYKPHPDVEIVKRKGAIPEADALRHADLILRNFPMGQLLPLVDEVHTLTSLTGFEALLRGVKVFTYGGPFYAGWGLTEDCARERAFLERRKASLNLDELTAGVLLLYPAYYDWQTNSFCRAEDVCHRLLQPGGQKKGRIWSRLASAGRSLLRSFGQ